MPQVWRAFVFCVRWRKLRTVHILLCWRILRVCYQSYIRCVLRADLLLNLNGQCNLLTMLIWQNQDPRGSYYMTNICYGQPSGTALTCSKLQHIEMCRHNVALQFAIMGSFITFEAGSNDPSRIISEASNYRHGILVKRREKQRGMGWKCHENFLLC